MARARQVVFRIFYSTSFTIVFLILISFICITPADALYESWRRHRLLDIFLITGAYVLTALIAALMYASRLYTNRSVLKDIPKTFMPIEKEDLPGRRVHRLIQDCLDRSAVIAYQARPRSKRIEHEPAASAGAARMLALTKSSLASYTDQNVQPPWGKIAHPGWSSPASKEMPNLEYATVVDELTDLIEAKAVSLVPVDPTPAELSPDGTVTPMPDPRVIDELARPPAMGMRQYLRHLIERDVVPDTALTAAFLAAYERARFSSQPLTDEDFQALMRMFAELLRNMRPVNVDLLDLDADGSASYEPSLNSGEVSSIASDPGPDPRRDNLLPSSSSSSSAASTFSNSGSVRHHRPPPRRISEDSAAPPSLSHKYQLEAYSYGAAANDKRAIQFQIDSGLQLAHGLRPVPSQSPFSVFGFIPRVSAVPKSPTEDKNKNTFEQK
ncbi:hypothetical protein ABEF91_001002 [Exophiala dermatitidis]